jgi:hypothetical protein
MTEPVLSDPEFRSVLRAELHGEHVRTRAHARDVEARRGVAWSGLGPEAWRPRSRERVATDAAARLQALQAWRAGARGRLLASVAQAQFAAETAHGVGETVRAALARDPDGEILHCAAAVSALVAESRALARAARAARRAVREAFADAV